MVKTDISYNQILNTAMDCLVKDPELNLNKCDVFPSAKLLQDLGMDDTAKLQLIMDLEASFHIDIKDEEILNRKLLTLDQFCLAVYHSITGKPVPVLQKPSFWQRIKEQFSR